jgi:predicted short-subunit dehydrogenase-like oxidoreductase (DUF2520 family)
MKELRIGFIGAGTVGTALAMGLAAAGYNVVAAGSRSEESARRLARRVVSQEVAVLSPQGVVDAADLVFLTVPDDAIERIASSLRWQGGKTAVHCSGAAPLSTLEAVAQAGARVGAFHPLQTFADADTAARALAGVTFAVEARDDDLRETLHQMAAGLGGRAVDIPSDRRALYHISGVLASNYLVTLLAEAAELWARFGYDRAEGLRALLPLVRGTVGNVETQGTPQALTGPIARGDVGTVAAHLAALREQSPETLSLYREMAARTLRIAREKGRLTGEAADQILALIDDGEPRQGGSHR